MKFSTAFFAAAGFAGLSSAANTDASDVAFFTVLVNDWNSNKRDYLLFIQTATNIPAQVSSLAVDVRTYQAGDYGYTTLLQNTALDVNSLRLFATELPWYTRIESELGVADVTQGSATASETGSGSGSGSIASETGETSGASATGGSVTSTKSSASSSASASSSSTAKSSSSSHAGGSVVYSSCGAALAAVALAFL